MSKSNIPQFNRWVDEAQSHLIIKERSDFGCNADFNGSFNRAEHIDVFAYVRTKLTGTMAPYDEWTDPQDAMVGRWIHRNHLLGNDEHTNSWFIPVTHQLIDSINNRRLYIFGVCQ